jgi:hypothetical protein
LLWAAVYGRPDIFFRVSRLAGKVGNPTVGDLKTGNKILEDMKRIEYTLKYFPMGKTSGL